MAVKVKEINPTDLKWAAILLLGVLLLLLLVFALLLEARDTPPDTQGLRPNPYGVEDFGYENGFMTCLTGESWLGVDVSHHQKEIDWQQVADAGVKFAMIRLGYRTLADGLLKEDTYGRTNLSAARNAGLKIGAYFFSQAITVEEAVEEAEYLLSLLNGTKLELPVVFDWEDGFDNSRAAGLDKETLNACAIAFCDRIRAAGYQPMVYFNPDLANRLLDLELMQQKGYGFWLAMYREQMNWPYAFDLWQYTESGAVPGIVGKVDINLLMVNG